MSDEHSEAVAQYLESLKLPISPIRLESYRPSTAGSDLQMIVTYLWNTTLSEAVYPVLQGLEVALRNSIDAALRATYGSDEWFDVPHALELRQKKTVIDAKLALQRDKRAITPGRVIAQLNFGFWTALLSRPYHTRLWEPHGYRLLDTVFPHVPRRFRNRDEIYQRYDRIRGIRNRVFHFEPIWSRADLRHDHREMLEAIGWISPTLRDSIGLFDRFDDVHERGWAQIEAAVRRYIGS